MSEINEITKTADFPLSAERVWRAVTDPEELSGWFSDHVQMVLEVGQEIIFKWDQYGTASGRIELIEPPQRFAFRWRAHNVPDEEPLTEANSTLVSFTVTPTVEGARLTVVESGFANLPKSMRLRTFQENTNGWEAEFADLLVYLAGLG
jgi:uncharacterized protein YndB with AHSA1/START domain